MYNLDRHTWQPKLHKKTDYMYIGWNEKDQLRSLYYSGRDWKHWHRREQEIDETMGCMGPCRFMSAKTFWDLGGCDEKHGSWGSEGIEWACKAWLSGGKMIVNKKTWFAHWFRGSDGGFPYRITSGDVNRARRHAENMWLKNKWEGQKYPFAYMINKFNPPTWDNYGKGVFIHVPKTAGLSVEKALNLEVLRNKPERWNGKTHVSFGHVVDRRIPHDLTDKFVFSFVRNPYDRAVSNWRYSTKGEITFKQYLKNLDKMHWHHRMAQAAWHRKKVDFVGKFENFEEDLRHIAKILNIELGDIPHVNASKHGPYWAYYDTECRDIVRERFKEDFEKYGYVDNLLQQQPCCEGHSEGCTG
jgi:hypothetical protein